MRANANKKPKSLLSSDQLKQVMLGKRSKTPTPPQEQPLRVITSCAPSDPSDAKDVQYSPVKLRRARNSIPITPENGPIHRTEAMFDLSNIQSGAACADYRSSIINLLEEFQRQLDATNRAASSRNSGSMDLFDCRSNQRSVPTSSCSEANLKSISTGNSQACKGSSPQRSKHVFHLDSFKHDNNLKMSEDYQRSLYAEDESDYVNLWESESGSSLPQGSFNTNQQLMSDFISAKGSAMFDREKYRNLQAKAESYDLRLSDYYDLEHSPSLLELFKSSMSLSQPADCKYKCHDDCESLITGQCAAGAENSSLSKIPSDCMDDTDSGYSGTPPGGTAGFTLTKEEICSRIITYNEKIGSSKGAMTMPAEDSGVFQGSIQVFINIDRPINMSLSSRPASIYDALQTPYKSPESTTSPELLPKNAVMSLHISSDNTASDVVGILLKKFKITDNPRSFALFEQTIENEKEIKLRKIGDQEKPLLNFLRWSTECKEVKRFVLKENDSGEIMYEAFSIPELYNFLAMLDKEKTLFHTEIQNKYAARRTHIAQRLREMQESPQVVKTSR